MDKNASSADDPRDGVIDVERLEESWWPPAAHTFPTPRGLNGADWRALRTAAGELGPGDPADGDEIFPLAAEAYVDPDASAPPRRIGWVAAIVPLVVVGGIVGLVVGGSGGDEARSALGGPSTVAVTAATSGPSTSAPATSAAPTTSAATTTVASVTTTATSDAPASSSTAPATTEAPTTVATTATTATTAAPVTTATTAASPPVTLASPSDARALDDIDLAGLNWWGELRDGTIFLRGRVASVAARETAIANARSRAGDARVVEQLLVDPSISATRPLDAVPLFVTDRVYFTGANAQIATSYQNLLGFARFSLFTDPKATLTVVVRTPPDTEGTSLARARAEAVVTAVVGDAIARSRVSVSTEPALGDAAGNDELRRRDDAALLVLYGTFGAPSA